MTYEWVHNIEAVAITYVRGLDVRQLGTVLNFDWATERSTMFEEAQDQQDLDTGRLPVQVEQVESQRGSWLVLVEPNGYLASLPEALSELADADVAVSVFWNVNAQMQVALFADGILIRSFDPLLPDLVSHGEPLAEEEGLPFGLNGDPKAAAMALAERLTGVALDRDWLLAVPHATWTATGYAAG